jgi:hypothetical protein
MARTQIAVLILCTGLVVGTIAAGTPAYANGYKTGGTATTGTAVRTGHGPLYYPVPPAVSTLNPPYSPQRPQNFRGPASTYPSPPPFGTPY